MYEPNGKVVAQNKWVSLIFQHNSCGLTLKWIDSFFYLEKCPFDILIYDFTVNEWVESCKTQGTFYFLKRNFAMTIQTNKRRPIIFKSHDNYQFHVKPFWHWLEIVLTWTTLIEVDFIENVNKRIIFCSLLSVWCLIYARLL